MTPRRQRARLSQRARRLTVAAVVGVAVCIGAAAFELNRALAGNTVSWVYTFEWPLIAAYGIHIRHKLVADEREQRHRTEPATVAQETTGILKATTPDPGLAAWQDYVARLRAADPPGGPPASRPRG